jgi:YkoY family integral membrane protein
MELLEGFYHNFLRFFSWEEISFLFTGTGVLVMLNLVLSEGLLSFDNALVLAILVSHLPKDEYYELGPFKMSIQQWGLTAGIAGAYFFRTIAIVLGTYLIQFWTLQLIGGGYLLWLGYEHFFAVSREESETAAYGKGFWATVIKVELMDIAFSIDSILAALGISKKVWVILMGGMIGILCMRLVAGVFIRLIERFPLFKHTGYALVALIGFRLVSEVDWIHFHKLFTYLGPVGVGVLILFTVVVWGTAQVRKARLRTIKSLIQLTLLILFFSWSGTRLHLHMSDLVFSIVMLATFSSTFIFNGLYLRWQSEHEQRKAGITQSNHPPPVKGSEKNVEQQEKPQ